MALFQASTSIPTPMHRDAHGRLSGRECRSRQSEVVGRNVMIDYRWGAGDVERNRKYAAELVALAPQVILANSTQAVAALLQATRTVPIVFVGLPDPVGAGFGLGRAATSPGSSRLNTPW